MFMLIYLDNGIEDYLAFKKEWGSFTIDIVFMAAILAIYTGLGWKLYHERERGKDNVIKWLKLVFAFSLLIIVFPYVSPKGRPFELVAAVGRYIALVGIILGYIVRKLQALGKQPEENSE